MIENQYTNTEEIVEQKPLKCWHTPEISRVDLKRTLSSPGSFIDGASGSLL